jgi:pimeloyl-ACP methyl ester carboxylesterase
MATFVLIHGAWHGGWCWWKVAPLLRAQGHDVLTPSLTGLGEREHLARLMPPAMLNLDLHVRDITQVLESNDLRDVILVAHAYAGMVVTGAAEVCPERLGALVFVNGVVPGDGEAMVDQLEAVRGPDFVARIRQHIADGSPFMPAPTTGEEIAERWSITDPADQEFVLPKLSPQPTLTFAQAVRTGRPDAAGLRREFVLCSESGFDAVAERASENDWGVHRIDTGHDPMITAPRELADILVKIAAH